MSTEANLAALVSSIGAPANIKERAIPKPGPKEILIRNHAIGLNPIDWKRQASGFLTPFFPVVLGADSAGVVVDAGAEVTKFKPGDRVMGFAHGLVSGNNDNASHQQYTAVTECSCALLPDTISFVEAATLPTAVGCATLALFRVLGLPKPDEMKEKLRDEIKAILIWGGASAVGSTAIQLAHKAGLRVFVTASEKHHDYLKSLGASVLVDYHSRNAVGDLVSAIKESGLMLAGALDVISSPKTLTSTAEVLRQLHLAGDDKLILAHTAPWPKDHLLPLDEDSMILEKFVPGESMWGPNQDLLVWLCHEKLTGWMENGVVLPKRARVMEGGLSGIQDALEVLKQGVSGEKLVIEV